MCVCQVEFNTYLLLAWDVTYETSGWWLRYVMCSRNVHQLILQLIYDVYFLHEAEDVE